MTTTKPDTLTHHGVKGMKWGVRKKAKPQSGRMQSFAEKASTNERFSAARRKKLEEQVSILRLERELASLSGSPKRSSAVKRVLARVGEQSVTAAGTQFATWSLNQALQRAVPAYAPSKKK